MSRRGKGKGGGKNKGDPADPPADQTAPRRKFLFEASTLAAGCGLAASYGTLGAMAGRFLYPARGLPTAWVFVTEVSRLKPGESLRFVGPAGEAIAVARQGGAGTLADFIALSSTCPHLGCQVHWDGPQDRFYCPCHNGTFNPSGKGIGGPPGEAGQSLSSYALKIESGMLFIEVPTEVLPGPLKQEV